MGQKYPKYEKSGQKLPIKGDFVQLILASASADASGDVSGDMS